MITFSAERSLGSLRRSSHPYAPVVKRRYVHQWVRYHGAMQREREHLFRWLRGEHHAEVQAKLQRLLTSAYDTVPWHHQRMREAGLVRGDLSDARALQALPVMGRADVQQHFLELVSEGGRAWERRDFFRGRTSGSTGEPLQFLADGFSFLWFWTFIDLVAKYHDVSLNIRPLHLDMVQLCALGHSPEYGSLLPLFHGARFEKRHIKSLASKRDIERAQPRVFTGDPDSLSFLFDLNVKPRLVLSSAFAWPSGKREALAAHLECPVVDYYSAQEVGPMAISCKAGQGMHVLDAACVVQTTASREVLVTNLRNVHFPLLRYAVGDMVTPTDKRCPCGLHAPRLLSLDGRAMVRFLRRDGSCFDPQILNPVMTRMRSLREFRVKELGVGRYEWHVVSQPAGGPTTLEKSLVSEALRHGFGGDIELHVTQGPSLRSPGEKPRPFVAMQVGANA